MARRFRALSLAVLLGGALLLQAAPVSAASLPRNDAENQIPVLIDVLLLRPAGLAMTVGGIATYTMLAPFVAITRPTDLGKPLRPLVIEPVRFTFVDPLGTH